MCGPAAPGRDRVVKAAQSPAGRPVPAGLIERSLPRRVQNGYISPTSPGAARPPNARGECRLAGQTFPTVPPRHSSSLSRNDGVRGSSPRVGSPDLQGFLARASSLRQGLGGRKVYQKRSTGRRRGARLPDPFTDRHTADRPAHSSRASWRSGQRVSRPTTRSNKRSERRSTPEHGTVVRILREHIEGELGEIARGLDGDIVPTGQGGRQWWLSTVGLGARVTWGRVEDHANTQSQGGPCRRRADAVSWRRLLPQARTV
jgi:hypothetical protein